jgi:putative oxidoreductase
MLVLGIPKLMKFMDGGGLVGRVRHHGFDRFLPVLCSALLVLGLWTRLALIQSINAMAVAAFYCSHQ